MERRFFSDQKRADGFIEDRKEDPHIESRTTGAFLKSVTA